MNRIVMEVKELSTNRLLNIIGEFKDSYSLIYIDCVKDELIKRGEILQIETEVNEQVTSLDDEDLKDLVEREYTKYNLEYVDLARKEYLKRNFKNQYDENDLMASESARRYPGLRIISNLITGVAWVYAALTIVGVIYGYSEMAEQGNGIAMIYLVISFLIGAFFFVILISLSELIKVILDIEENTRKSLNYYTKTNDQEERDMDEN